MKHIIALLLALLLCASPALAAGNLEVTHSHLIDTGDYLYFYARVENTGDADINTGIGTLLLYDENEVEVYEDNFISTDPSGALLKPGQYVYVSTMVWGLPEGTEAAYYAYTQAADNYGDSYLFLPAEVTSSITYEEDAYGNYFFVTLTNDTDAAVKNCEVNVAAYDAENKLISVTESSLYNLSIHPGSTVTLQVNVPQGTLLHCIHNDVRIETLDVQVYCEP